MPSYEFSVSWVIGGLIVVVIGLLLLRFYRQIADNFFITYSRMKMVGLIICVVGFLAALNLLPWFVRVIVNWIYPGSA